MPEFQLNHRTNTLKIFIYVQIAEAKHTKTPERFQILRAFRIIFFPFFFVMLPAVQFDDHPGFWTEKIHNIPTDHFLPLKLNGMCS